jgi:hypothetical protein
MASGAYYVLQKGDDRNLEDISIRREDGVIEEIYNFPYRINQMPAYIFEEFIREDILREDGTNEIGARIFRVTDKGRDQDRQAA